MDIVESIVEKYPLSYLEVAHIQYYDDVLEIYLEVKSDQDLMAIFENLSRSKIWSRFDGYIWEAL